MQSEFSSLRGDLRALVYKRRANSPFLRAAPRCRVKKAKAWFCLFRVFVFRDPSMRAATPRLLRMTGGSTVNARLCHPERSGERNVSRAVEWVLRASALVTNAFTVFGTAYRSVQDPSPRFARSGWQRGIVNARLCHPERSGERNVSRAVERVSSINVKSKV